jgi:signal transduction histidine kinase
MEKSNILVTMHSQHKLVKVGKFFSMLLHSFVNLGTHHKDFTEKQRDYVAYTNRIVFFIALLLGSLVFMTMAYTDNLVLIITHMLIPPSMILAQAVKWGNHIYLSTNLLCAVPSVALTIFDDQFITRSGEEGGFFLYFFLMAFIISMSIRHTTYSFLQILALYLYPVIGMILCFKNSTFFGYPELVHPYHIGKTFFFNTITVFSLSTFFLILQMSLNVNLAKEVDNKQKQIIELIEKENLFAMKAVMDAEENEKKRISAELHDGVGQLLAATKASLEHVNIEQDGNRYSSAIVLDCIQMLRLAMNEVRNISHDLMPAVLDDEGLHGALQQICKNSKLENGTAIEFKYRNERKEELNPGHPASLHLYRIVQECAGNILKHSKATNASIQLSVFNDQLVLKIADNGKGFKEGYKKGNGLKNIRNRCNAIGAELSINTSVLEGTMITIELYDLKRLWK